MHWTLAVTVIVAAGAYGLGFFRGVARTEQQERRRLIGAGVLGIGLIVVLGVGLEFLPWHVQRWVILGFPVLGALWVARVAARKQVRGPALEYYILLIAVLLAYAGSSFISGWASTLVFASGFLMLIVGGRVIRARHRQLPEP